MKREDMIGRLDRFIGIKSEDDNDAPSAIEGQWEEWGDQDTPTSEDESGSIYEAEIVAEAPDLEGLEVKAAVDMAARIDSIVSTIRKAERLLDNLSAVIDERDEARDYEVAATMVNAIVSANKTVMDIHKDTIKLKKGSGKTISIGTVNTTNQTANVTVSSTKDIMRQLKEIKQLK